MQIRDERPTDYPEINDLLDQAFPGEQVGRLVADLRAEGDLLLSLVAEREERVIGQVGFSPVAIAPCLARVVQLSPLAVAEPDRCQGIGARLVETGIERCRALAVEAVLVLGDPNYYRRFGFDPLLAAPLRSRWSGPHLMALELHTGALSGCSFLSLSPAFERLA